VHSTKAKKEKRGVLRFTERKTEGEVTTSKVGRARLRALLNPDKTNNGVALKDL
jgi:hypothetical protein